jgi:hypothetical protein
MFSDGGPIMLLVLLLGIALFALTIVQLARTRKADWSPLLWGLLAGLLLCGALGSVLGMTQGFEALAMVAPDQRAALMARAVAMALGTATLALVFALPLSFLIGLASFLAKRAVRRLAVKG